MDRVELFPSLEHCIETAARDVFRSSVSRYLEGGLGDRELEGKKVKFVVCWQEGQPDCRMAVVEDG